MARQRTDPDGGEERDELAELVAEIRSERDELLQRIETLESARSEPARREARREVRQSESGLAKALRDAGFHDLSEDDLHELRSTRQRAQFDRWLDERIAREEAAAAGDEKDAGKRSSSKKGDVGEGKAGEGEGKSGRRPYFG